MANLPEIHNYDDEKFEALEQAMAVERERRNTLSQAPAQIASIKQRFQEAGGDPADLD